MFDLSENTVHLCGHLLLQAKINSIKSVQRWFTKRIKPVSNLTYDERLIKLRNDRLELRRLRADLLMCFNTTSFCWFTPRRFFHYE